MYNGLLAVALILAVSGFVSSQTPAPGASRVGPPAVTRITWTQAQPIVARLEDALAESLRAIRRENERSDGSSGLTASGARSKGVSPKATSIRWSTCCCSGPASRASLASRRGCYRTSMRNGRRATARPRRCWRATIISAPRIWSLRCLGRGRHRCPPAGREARAGRTRPQSRHARRPAGGGSGPAGERRARAGRSGPARQGARGVARRPRQYGELCRALAHFQDSRAFSRLVGPDAVRDRSRPLRARRPWRARPALGEPHCPRRARAGRRRQTGGRRLLRAAEPSTVHARRQPPALRSHQQKRVRRPPSTSALASTAICAQRFGAPSTGAPLIVWCCPGIPVSSGAARRRRTGSVPAARSDVPSQCRGPAAYQVCLRAVLQYHRRSSGASNPSTPA